MSQAPQLLAYFLMPVIADINPIPPMDDTARNSQPWMQAQQTVWSSDPKRRLLCIVTDDPKLFFVISTRLFFDPDLFEGKVVGILGPFKFSCIPVPLAFHTWP